MPVITSYQPGRFCWTDLATTDAEGAKTFYSTLFGWDFRSDPSGAGMEYFSATLQGAEVAGLYRMSADETQQGLPSRWKGYVAVASADQVAEKAAQVGGRLLAAPFDVFDLGRMAVIQDPAGGVFQIWEARRHPGAGLIGTPGTMCWNELMTEDTEKARAFYAGLFGWTPQEMPGPLPYTVFNQADSAVAGMMPIPPECPESQPSWLVYFLVEDCDASSQTAATAGGKILKPSTDIESIGRFAVIEDPQGAVFALFKAFQALS